MTRLGLSFSHFILDLWIADIEKYSGLLYDCPDETEDIQSLEFYERVAYNESYGWHVCPRGYAVFVGRVSVNEVVVIPGLNVSEVSQAVVTLKNSMPPLQMQTVQNHVSAALALVEFHAEQLHKELRSFVHEIKKINTEIYNQSFALVDNLASSELQTAAEKTKSILEHSNLLRIRTDFMHFIANPEVDMPSTKSSAIESMVRIVEMFQLTKPTRRAIVTDHTNFLVSGPNFFDLVSFISLENAYKYSPADQPILISFEIGQYENSVKITNYGPKIEDDEFPKIYQGYRCKAAEALITDGEGMGLPTLKRIVEDYFFGRVTLTQTKDNPIIVGDLT